METNKELLQQITKGEIKATEYAGSVYEIAGLYPDDHFLHSSHILIYDEPPTPHKDSICIENINPVSHEQLIKRCQALEMAKESLELRKMVEHDQLAKENIELKRQNELWERDYTDLQNRNIELKEQLENCMRILRINDLEHCIKINKP